MEVRDADSVALDDEMLHHVTDPPTSDGMAKDTAMGNTGETSKPLMWSVEEELVVTTTRPPRSALRSLGIVLRNATVFIVLISFGLNLRQILDAVVGAMTGRTKQQLPF